MVLRLAGEVSIQMEGIRAHFNASILRPHVLKPSTLLLLRTGNFPISCVNSMSLSMYTVQKTLAKRVRLMTKTPDLK